jgi:L-Ala-D/L-Glu epimerase
MIIDTINIKPFLVPFITPLITAENTYTHREGNIISLIHDQFTGFGEISPLPGFSKENLVDCNQIIDNISNIISSEIDLSIDELLEIVDENTENYPSVKFGFETAIFDLISKENNQPLAEYLNPIYQKSILTNKLFTNERYYPNNSVIKIKVGVKPFNDEIDLILNLQEEFGNQTKFRLDANGTLDFQTALRYCKEFSNINIDYFEQPLPKENLLALAELRTQTDVPIAIDESLTDFNSALQIISSQSADVFVIKPMISGGFRESLKIIKLARQNNIRTVISSALETPIGLLSNFHLASAYNIKEHCGLNTAFLLSNDFGIPIEILDNKFTITNKPGLGFDELV